MSFFIDRVLLRKNSKNKNPGGRKMNFSKAKWPTPKGKSHKQVLLKYVAWGIFCLLLIVKHTTNNTN